MVANRVAPVVVGVTSGADYVVVGDFSGDEGLVEFVVDSGEEIVGTAVEDEVKVAGLDSCDLSDCGMFAPTGGVCSVRTQAKFAER